MIQRKHRDLFEHLIQEAARLIATLLGMDTAEAERQLDLAFKEWIGIERQELDELSDEEFQTKVNGPEGLDVNNLNLLAELYAKEGTYYFEKKNFLKSKQKLERAVWLFEEVDKIRQVFSFERQDKLQQIKAHIQTIASHYQNDNF